MINQNKNLNILNLLKNLDELYNKEKQLKKQMRFLIKEYKQLEQDKELLELILMHQSNKQKWHKK